MDDALGFLIRHGYSTLFVLVLVDQLGLPLPAAPFLLAAGALAQAGSLNPGAALGLSVLASVLAHGAWYQAGRRGGGRVLRSICRISLEPDVCVRRTENVFARLGAKTLVIAHFVPGLDTVAQPLAGMSGMAPVRYLAFSLLGAVVWAGSFLGLGYAFGREMAGAAQIALRLGTSLLAVALGAFLAYIGWKIFQRRRLLRELRTARISPEELKRRIAAGEPLTIVDLRHPLEREADPRTIPGAIRMAAEELDQRLQEIAKDGEVVLYCT